MRAEPERRRLGPHVASPRGHHQTRPGQEVGDREVQAPLPALLRAQPAAQRDGVVGLFQHRPAGPAGQPVDRVETLRLGQGELVALAGKGVPAVTDPVGPRHQQLTTPTRAGRVGRVSGKDVAATEGIGAQATPHLDHDSLMLTMSDGPLVTAGQNAHTRDDTAGPISSSGRHPRRLVRT